MENNFKCPFCNSFLNIGEDIVLTVKTTNEKQGLMLLSPSVGDYSVKTHPELQIKDGEYMNFYCPVCKEELIESEVSENLGKVIMIDKNNIEHTILFSKIKGERCTYRILDKKIVEYGEESSNYINFFGL